MTVYNFIPLVLKKLKLSSKNLAHVSILLWVSALFFQSIVFYSERETILGLHILGMGWLSPLALNFAWFANIFFIYAYSKIIKGDLPTNSSIFAILLSLDTFRFVVMPSGSGGGSTVYGYGWGTILWFMAILLLFVSTSLRELELNGVDIQNAFKTKSKSLFMALVITLLATSLFIFFIVHDRLIANDDELSKLKNIAFKRSKVCEATSTPVTMKPISNFSGSLEIIFSGRTLQANYPFKQTKDILDWGIPIIRDAATEFTLEKTSSDSIYWTHQKLWGHQVTHPATAKLYINESEDFKTISAKLIETKSNRVIFDQTWTQELNTSYYCPKYTSFPSENDYPRKLIMQALGLAPIHEADLQ